MCTPSDKKTFKTSILAFYAQCSSYVDLFLSFVLPPFWNKKITQIWSYSFDFEREQVYNCTFCNETFFPGNVNALFSKELTGTRWEISISAKAAPFIYNSMGYYRAEKNVSIYSYLLAWSHCTELKGKKSIFFSATIQRIKYVQFCVNEHTHVVCRAEINP